MCALQRPFLWTQTHAVFVGQSLPGMFVCVVEGGGDGPYSAYAT